MRHNFDSDTTVFEILVITVQTKGDECHESSEGPVAFAVYDVTNIPKDEIEAEED